MYATNASWLRENVNTDANFALENQTVTCVLIERYIIDVILKNI